VEHNLVFNYKIDQKINKKYHQHTITKIKQQIFLLETTTYMRKIQHKCNNNGKKWHVRKSL
jgi:hypothetical protein